MGLAATGNLFRYLAAKMYHLVLFLLIFTILQAAGNSNDPAKTIRCLLLKNYQKSCNILAGHPVPSHLVQIFKELPQETREKLESNAVYWNLTTKEYDMIHPSFWLLTSIERLSKFPGSKLSSVVLHWPDDSSVAVQVMNSLRTTDQKKDFISGLNPKSGSLSERVQSVISSALVNWDEAEWDLPVLVHNANSLLLHFPAEYLLTSSRPKSSDRLLFFVTSWEGFGDAKKWMEQPAILRRKVAHVFLSNSHKINEWSERELQKFGHLIPGMTAEELSYLNYNNIHLSAETKKHILNMGGMDIQQIRTLFDVFYSETSLTKNDFANLLQIVAKLSPNQLNKFNIKKLNLKELKAGSSMKELAGLKQLLQMNIASNVMHFNKSMDVTEWGEEIKYLGPLIAALPLNELKLFSNHEFDEVSLSFFELPVINFVQAYCLTRNGRAFDAINPKLVSQLHHLVQALPSSAIRNNRNKDVSSRSWSNLLYSLTGDNVPRFVLMYQIFESIGMDDSMDLLLGNENNYKMLGLLPSRTLENIAGFLSRNLQKFMTEYDIRISLLPKVLMALVLNVNRAGPWTWDSFISKKFLNSFLVGLTCSDVYNIETNDFPLIMSEYNKQRISAGLVFPKDLQFCCQQKLMEYLEMKSKLLQDEVNEGLMTLLEPGEIEALGGYILSSLPPKAISTSNHRSQILKLIGQLSVPELITGMSETQRSEIINIFFDYHGLNEDSRKQIDETHLFHMGNLTLFLPRAAIKRIKPEALKLLLDINYIDKRVCADNVTRNEWASLIRSAFGEPSEWKSERLTIIGDLMLVLNDSDWLQIKQESLQGAGVSLSNNFGEMIDWVPEDTEYYKACISTLNGDEKALYMSDLKKLVRWQLIAVQLELNTIKSASGIIEEDVLQFPLERPLKFNYSMKFLQPPTVDLYLRSLDNSTRNISDGSRTHEDLKEVVSKVENSSFYDSMKPMGKDLLSTSPQTMSTMEMGEVTQTTHRPEVTANDSNMKSYPLDFANNPFYSHKDSNTSRSVEVGAGSEVNKTVEENLGVIELSTLGLMPQVANESADSKKSDMRSSNEGARRISMSGGRFPKNSTSDNETIPVFTTVAPTTTQKSEAVTQSHVTTTQKIMATKKHESALVQGIKWFLPLGEMWGAIDSLDSDTTDHKNTSQNATLNSSVSINSSLILNPEKMIANDNSSQDSVQKRSSDDFYDKSMHPDSLIAEDVSSKVSGSHDVVDEDDDNDDDDDDDDDEKIRRRRNLIVDSSVGGVGQHYSKSTKETVQEEMKISCDSLRIVGDISKLAFEESDLEKFTNLEIENCLDVFREMELSLNLKKKILKRINKNDLNLLGSLLQAIQVEDLEKKRFNFDEPWVLETLSHFSSFPPEEKTINFILKKVKEHNAGSQIGPEVLISLKGLICHMDREDRKRLLSKPKELKLATTVLGQTDNNCSSECLTDLAEFAKDYMNFGDPKTYRAQDLSSLGVIAAGFNNEDWKNLLEHEGSAISVLHSSAVKCMSKEKLEIIPEDNFHLIPYKTLRFLESAKYSSLKESQKAVLTKILNDDKPWEEKLLPRSNSGNSGSDPSLHEASYSTLYISILLFIFILVLIYIFCRMRSSQ